MREETMFFIATTTAIVAAALVVGLLISSVRGCTEQGSIKNAEVIKACLESGQSAGECSNAFGRVTN